MTLTAEQKSFLEWIRLKPGSMAFQLNKKCDNCQHIQPIIIYSEIQRRWLCGICHNSWVSFDEPIER